MSVMWGFLGKLWKVREKILRENLKIESFCDKGIHLALIQLKIIMTRIQSLWFFSDEGPKLRVWWHHPVSGAEGHFR